MSQSFADAVLGVLSDPTQLPADFLNYVGIQYPAQNELPTRNITPEFFNVMSYAQGAAGDGVTDDSAAIARIDAACAAAGGTLYLPAGKTFLCSNLSLSSTKIDGGGTLVLNGNTPILTLAGSDVSVKNIKFAGVIGNSAGTGLVLNGVSTARISNCHFQDFLAGGVTMTGTCSEITIANCVFGNGYGILPSSTATITKLAIIGNVFEDGATHGDAIEINVPSGSASQITIVGNIVGTRSCPSGSGIGIALSAGQQSANAIQNFTIANNVVIGTSNDGIHVEQNTFGGTITGNRVSSCGRDGICIVASASTAPNGSRDIVVSGNVVTSCNQGGTAGTGNAGIATESFSGGSGSRITINNNQVRGCGAFGIQVSSQHTHCMVVGNIASNNTGPGILTGDSSHCIVALNRCYDDQGTPTQTYGLQVQNSQTNTIIALNDLDGNGTAPYNEVSVGSKTKFRKIINLPAGNPAPPFSGVSESDAEPLERIEAWFQASDFSAWNNTGGITKDMGGWIPQDAYIVNVRMHVTVAFTGTTSPTMSVGFTGALTGFATATALGVAGILAPTLGTQVGYQAGVNNRTGKVTFNGSGGTAPTAGKVLVIVEFYRVSTTP